MGAALKARDDLAAPHLRRAAHLDAGRRVRLHDEIVALGAQAFLTGTGRDQFETLGTRAEWLEVPAGGGPGRTGQA